ncbi:MAG: MATE family efflux transporter [Lachnospiraceae bacterium]|nr:MATE family efflux transporter [Lachnospiraceae bacterium]
MKHEFENTEIKKLVLKLGIPAMFAQFFNVLYSIVDRIFVGNIAGEGELALAAVGVCAPVLTAISAFAYMVGIGGSSVMSISLGKRDKQEAQKAINNSFMMLVAISVVVTVLALAFQRPLLFLLGISEKMYPLASRYFTVYVLGTIVSLCGIGMNQFILAQGYAKKGMKSLMLGTVVNVVLDPLLIFGLDMGIQGAALATVLAQIVVCVYVLHFLLKKQDIPISLTFGGYGMRIVKRILSIGFMSFLITFMDNMILILMNMSLRKYGGDMGDSYIASAAIIQSFMALINCPGQGITSGCGTLFSYHYGAGNYKKVMEAFRHVLFLCLGFIGLLLIAVQWQPEVFVRLFVRDGSRIAETSVFLKRYTLGMLGIAVQLAYVDGLTAMGKIRFAFPMSIFRKCVYIMSLLVLPLLFSVDKIFFVGTVSDVIGASFTLILFYTVAAKSIKRELKKYV